VADKRTDDSIWRAKHICYVLSRAKKVENKFKKIVKTYKTWQE